MQIEFVNKGLRYLFFITLFFTIFSVLVLIVDLLVIYSSLLPESWDSLLGLVFVSNGFFVLAGLVEMGIILLFGSRRPVNERTKDQDNKVKAG